MFLSIWNRTSPCITYSRGFYSNQKVGKHWFILFAVLFQSCRGIVASLEILLLTLLIYNVVYCRAMTAYWALMTLRKKH